MIVYNDFGGEYRLPPSIEITACVNSSGHVHYHMTLKSSRGN